MRAGLVAVLESDESIEIVGQASTGREAVALTRRRQPDVVLMDVQMPDLDGIAATRELTGASTAARVLILTTFEEDDYIFGGLRAGASGFLLKRTRPEELLEAIQTVAAGDSLLSPSVTRVVLDRLARQPTPQIGAREQLEGLTAREREVLELVAEGRSNAAVAKALVLSVGAVEKHIASIFQKLGLPPSDSDHRRVLAVLAYLGPE
jgi:DNA-binding NarL/FixJ family response regulator